MSRVESQAGFTFDVRDYARTAQGSLREEIELEPGSLVGLDADVRAMLRILQQLESATMAHLRNVLVTPTHKDARVTAFLVTWAYEKFWIADALGALLDAAAPATSGAVGTDSTADSAASATSGSGASGGVPGSRRAESATRRGPVRRALAALAEGPEIVGVHTAVGLTDDRVLATAYGVVVERAADETVSRVLGRILEIKSRHDDFFREESERRLAGSAKTVKLLHRELGRTVFPLAATELADADRSLFARVVFAGTAGASRADSVAAEIAALPGLGEADAENLRGELR